MRQGNDQAEQPKLLTHGELEKLRVERHPSHTRSEEGETAPSVGRSVHEAPLTEAGLLVQEELPGIEWTKWRLV